MLHVPEFAEKITTQWFNYFNMPTYLIIIGIIVTINIITIVTAERARYKLGKHLQNLKHQQNLMTADTDDTDKVTFDGFIRETKHRDNIFVILTILAFTLIILCSAGAYAITDTYLIAKDHGYNAGPNVNIASLWTHIHTSPVEDEIPGTVEGKLFILYRFGCADCNDTYEDIRTKLEGISDTYWIASRSDQGQAFLKEHPVPEVPTALYIKQDGTELTFKLYKTLSTGKSVIDEDNFTDLLSAIEYDRRQ